MVMAMVTLKWATPVYGAVRTEVAMAGAASEALAMKRVSIAIHAGILHLLLTPLTLSPNGRSGYSWLSNFCSTG